VESIVTDRDPVRASLIVLNYNGRDVLESCLDSLAAAISPTDEIIVVDSCSHDGSREALEKRDDVKLVALDRNTYIFGLNAGLAVAQGEYVAFLNNDIIVEQAFVEKCLELFSGERDVFAVCPRILDKDGADQGSRTRGTWKRGLIFYDVLPHSSSPSDCFFAVGGQSFFRRSMLEEIGSIDPLLWPMYHEDIELSYRAWKRGWRIRYAPQAVVHHLGGHSSTRVFTSQELRSFVRQNEYLIVWKNVTDGQLVAEHIALVPARLVAALAHRDWPTIKGFARALGRLPRALRARKSARMHMVLSDRQVLERVGSIN
jgi:GT2 family glycosyltransferase